MLTIQDILRADLWKKSVIPVVTNPDFSEKDFISRWNERRNALEQLLSKRWIVQSYKEADFQGDFEVAGDFNLSWTLHGSIYSRKTLRGHFVQALRKFVSESPQGERWAVHFVIEITGEPPRIENYGEFLLLDDCLYIPSDGKFDYSAFIESIKGTK